MFTEKVGAFAKFMVQKLEEKQYENDDTWDVCKTSYLLRRMKEEVEEVKDLLKREPPIYEASDWKQWQKKLALECADVANFAMMIADRLGVLGEGRNKCSPKKK